MVIPTKGFQSDTSLSSEVDDLSFHEKRVQLFAKQMLQGRLFIGMFQEKRYVDSINSYRDVVCLAKEEHELIQDILAVKERVDNLYSGNHWVGFTTPDMVGTPACHSIWVELPETTLLGKYWFKIRRIKFGRNETCLRVKILRPVDQETQRNSSENKENNCNVSNYDVLEDIKEQAKENLTHVFKNVTTMANFKESIIFLCMLLATLVISLFELLKYISEYFLRFLNEFANFMNSVIPIFQIFANLIERLFRILCMLIAYLFKGSNLPSQNPYPRVSYSSYQALPAPPRRSGVIIEEVQ